MDRRIEVYATPQGFMARHVGFPDVVALFGTDTIPTAFTAQANPYRVLQAIRDLNPTTHVRLLSAVVPEMDRAVANLLTNAANGGAR